MTLNQISLWPVGRQLRRLRRALWRAPLVKRGERSVERAAGAITQQLTPLFDLLPIATKREVARLDRRVTQASQKLRALEKRQAATRRSSRSRSRSSGKPRRRKKR